jgi:hypothetical protein
MNRHAAIPGTRPSVCLSGQPAASCFACQRILGTATFSQKLPEVTGPSGKSGSRHCDEGAVRRLRAVGEWPQISEFLEVKAIISYAMA